MGKFASLTIVARILPDGFPFTVKGRDVWALQQLQEAGVRGCTPIDNPGPRWSGYVHKLRKKGLDIETMTENHGCQFAGHHARYILRSPVSLIVKSDDEQKEAA
ncbi:hypothetical protein G5V57_14360 [Nordella sp. HKS 07]|uniref:winged helix domain-containing protein n=1 Tax=Nordella sp. HKS 07 TaxID=2712222 RepID=UPI0013E1CB24|nr:hypothetical protein [Nordella sp. HKS 07]QIG48806.1 hypothetical protein G5V57_14360 [Nordella sp. HKS 07]